MILVVDNYDSLMYNLVDIVAQHSDVIVQYPDDDNVLNQSVDAVIISPGPGHPLDDQQLMKIISSYQDKTHFRYLPRCSSTDLLLRWRSH